jgi:hypothetical protein
MTLTIKDGENGPLRHIIRLERQNEYRGAVCMRLRRIPQRVSNCLSPLSASLRCPQGQHFRVFCWVLIILIVIQGSATLKALTRLMPSSLRYWTVLRMVRAGYWDAAALIEQLADTVLYCLPPPADGVLHLTADTTLKEKTGEQQPIRTLSVRSVARLTHRAMGALACTGRGGRTRSTDQRAPEPALSANA